MFPVGFEPIISAGERPQTYVLDRAATGTGLFLDLFIRKIVVKNLIKQSSPLPVAFVPRRPKFEYTAPHNLEHPQPTFPSQCERASIAPIQKKQEKL